MTVPHRTKSQILADNLSLRKRLTQVEDELARSDPDSRLRDPEPPERKSVEAALHASEVRYRRLFEAAKDGILILDAETGTITDSNPYLEEMLGFTHEELLGKRLWEIGPFRDIAAGQAAFEHLKSNEYIRYDNLPLETKRGEQRNVEFVSNLYLADNSRVIQCNIRDITARKLAEADIQAANERLSTLVTTLQRRDGEMTLLNQMNGLLQTCETQEEAYQVIALLAADLFPGHAGCLAVLRASGLDLETVARWGGENLVQEVFPIADCWAMRRGRPHEVRDPQANLVCAHFFHPVTHGYVCLPLTVQGETLGVFYLATSDSQEPVGSNPLAITVAEAVKLSLSNLKLRRKLHEQATRDPLTGLFNRRYLEETLPRDLHRTLRRDAPLSVVMIDLDHFKQFNDRFGHEAGDSALRETGRLLSECLRQSDLACRYGGEEFVLVLPDSSLSDTRTRLEQIRRRFEALDLRQDGHALKAITFSAGIASSPEHGSDAEGLLRAADEALYAAKRVGRNCIVDYQASEAPPGATKEPGMTHDRSRQH